MSSQRAGIAAVVGMAVIALMAGGAPARAGRIAEPYTDPSYLTKLAFGLRSDYLQPWRAFLQTVPSHLFVDAIGINLNLGRENPDLVCHMLAKNGVRCARIEIGWGNINWDDETKINGADKFARLLAACKRWGIRPLILLNAHQGVPCPARFFQRTVIADAPAGSRAVKLDDVSGLVLGHSGLSNLTGYWAAEALVVGIDGHTCKLSRPLPKEIKAGTKVGMATLKYRPFSVPGSDDWKQTMAGWRRYVGTVAAFVARTLGTTAAADKGFDMEIWNELTFGSEFLYINHYYDPPIAKYDENSVWANIVAATADEADAHKQAFSGVRFDDGFANTIPWPASSKEPARITAIGKHPYAGRRNLPDSRVKGKSINALGGQDTYCAKYTEDFPEYFGTAIQTETLMRDSAPITTEIYGTKHGRYARPGDPCTVWITEVGYAPSEDGVKDHDEALALKAKAVSRYLAFYVNKGVDKLTFYAAAGGDQWLGLVLDKFLAYARSHDTYPADDAPYTSPALRVMRRMSAYIGRDMDPKLEKTRALRVTSISDDHNHYQFAGDGTPAHPPLYDRDVLAILPYQANARRFVIAYYVMTRDIKATLAPEDFTVALAGLHGSGASVSAYDPIRDAAVPVKVVAAGADTLTLRLRAADYPYLLQVEEAGR